MALYDNMLYNIGMKLETCDTIVFTDIHGQASRLEPVLKYYGSDIRKISAGDGLDGGDSRAVMDLFGEYNVMQLLGNHEVVALGAMQETDQVIRDIWQSGWRHQPSQRYRYERNTLSSYGIDEKLTNTQAAEALHDKMRYLGHIGLLNQAQVYYETDDYIVVHAGLTDESWSHQRNRLDTYYDQTRHMSYMSVPNQIMDYDFSLSSAEQASGE